MKHYMINASDVSSEVFDNEAVVVNFVTGKYFGMSGAGPYIWRMFEKPCNLEQVTELLKSGYAGITENQVKKLAAFVESLVKEGLLTDIDEPVEISSNLPADRPGEYADPVLEIYDDLQELIVLDPIHDADPERGWPAQQRMIKP